MYGRPGQLHQPKIADQRTLTLQGWVSDRDPSDNPYTWAVYPLEEDFNDDRRWVDVTFRLGLIARLAGRPIELM